MLQTDSGESEIVLGNKQLVGIFFVVAILLGVAFAGGYMVGRSSTAKKPATIAATDTAGPTAPNASAAGAAASNPAGGETRTVSPDASASDQSASSNAAGTAEAPLGSAKRNKNPEKPSTSAPETASATGGFAPQGGQTFLQVTAVGRDEAAGVADVLRKKGFHAHAVPVPGSSAMYRVIVGPVKDAGDLASTRDELRKAGFGKVFVQHY